MKRITKAEKTRKHLETCERKLKGDPKNHYWLTQAKTARELLKQIG